MIVAVSIAPLGGDSTTDDGGVSQPVAQAIDVIRSSGLVNETNAMFTNIEGEWDEVMDVIKQAIDAVGEHAPRVSFVIKGDYRPGHEGQLHAKMERVEAQLRQD